MGSNEVILNNKMIQLALYFENITLDSSGLGKNGDSRQVSGLLNSQCEK